MKILRVMLAASALLAYKAEALRGRPVSDLRFENQVDARGANAASDGTDFLQLDSVYEWGKDTTVVQRVVGGEVIGPQRYIGRGRPVGLVWTGNHYLAGWEVSTFQGFSHKRNLFVAPVSRAGSPLAVPTQPVVQGAQVLMAADRVSAIAFGYTEHELIAQPLDHTGRPSGPARSHIPPVPYARVVAAAVPGGFAIVFSRYRGTWVMVFRADGTAITPAAILLDGPYDTNGYHSNGAAIASDGTDVLVVFSAGTWRGTGELKSVLLTTTGTIKGKHVIDMRADVGADGFLPAGLVWDGSQYVLAANVEMAPATYERDLAVGLFRLTSSGHRSGDPAWVLDATISGRFASSLASNQREFLVTTNAGPVFVDQAMRAAPPAADGRTVAAQQGLVVEARHDGYLAAWFETRETEVTIRASRIDVAGNYLDGEGIVLATSTGDRMRISIDGRGPHWFVAWSDGSVTWGRKILSSGVATGGGPVMIGHGSEIDILWDGSHYVVLRIDHEQALHTDRMTDDGVVAESRTLAQSSYGQRNGYATYLVYAEPTLVKLGHRVLATFLEVNGDCSFGSMPMPCGEDITVMGRPLDTNIPFVIGKNGIGGFEIAANSDGSSALVLWSSYQGSMGAFLSGESSSAPFRIDTDEDRRWVSSVAFDGTDFIAASSRYEVINTTFTNTLVMIRISTAGTILDEMDIPRDHDEILQSAELAGSAAFPILIGFTHQHPTYDNVSRGALLFMSEMDDVVTEAAAPVPVCATRNDDQTISVRWQPVADADGISLELQLFDGTWRPVAVAPGSSTSARVTLPGLEGSAIRLRSWNGSALSAPSSAASADVAPAATLRSALRTCAGVPVTIEYTLTGVAPFTVRWSDGLVQTNLTSSATRVATVSWDTTLRIVSVADGSCRTNEIPESIRLLVDDRPAIRSQTRGVTIPAGQTATLTVKATGDLTFAWFEGYAGDNTSRRVGKDARSFTTPALYQSTRYWVRVSNRCGNVVDSAQMDVTVTGPGKTRAVRR